MKLRYTPAAMADLQEIKTYISDTLMNPDAAQNLMVSIAAACAKLKDQPSMGSELRNKIQREVRERYLIHGKYIIIYDVTDAIDVLRVLDTRTNYLRALITSLKY